MVVYDFKWRSRQSFSRGEAAPVRTLGLKRNAGDCAGYGRQKRPADILPIRRPHAGVMSVDFCPYSSSVSHLHSKCDPPSPRGKVCAYGAVNNHLSYQGGFMERILIIGCPGAGKTTLARQLSEKLNLPVVHLEFR